MSAKFSSFDLCGPDPAALSCSEVEALKTLAARLPSAPVIVNIGAERGTSTLALLEERPSALVYSVDVDPCKDEFENIRKAGLCEHRVVRLRGKSQDIDALAYAPIDMLFVDGDHQYEAVKADIENWARVVKAGGVIAFHDYIEEPIPEHILSRVVYAVDEWLAGMEEPYKQLLYVHRLKAYQVNDGETA